MLSDIWVTAAIAMLAFVLAFAARAKLRERRAQAVAELSLAGAALLVPVAIAAAGLALVYAGFAVLHTRLRATGTGESCGCFGEPASMSVRVGTRRLGLTAASALLAVGAGVAGVVSHTRTPVALVLARPVTGLLALVLALVAAHLWRAAFTATGRPDPPSDRLVTASAQLLERRFSRRGLLVRLAAAGSALTVVPLRYLLYPGSAEAALVRRPEHCTSGDCTDGYTAFCCQIAQGLNSCPTDTFAGGWWMCTDYPGRKLCAEQGVRFYVDCNALPGREYPGGCRCANGSCDERRVACNRFRYGQCNTHVEGVTPVVCRMVVCENPSTISELNCSASLAVDDAVCEHEAPCLDPAVPVGFGGGV